MKSDYLETKKERAFIFKMKELLDVKQDQFKFFVDEYKQDKLFLEEEYKENIFKNYTKKAILKMITLSIPIASLHFSGAFAHNYNIKNFIFYKMFEDKVIKKQINVLGKSIICTAVIYNIIN